MTKKVYVYDPTISDQQSKVRGIGRYLQILQENFQDEWTFTNNLSSIIHHPSSIFVNPFFNFLQKPLIMRRIANKQIAIIHDLIPLKYPKHFPIGIKGNINVLLNKLTLKNYDLIVTVSQASKRDILHYLKIPEKKVKVIYNYLPKIFMKQTLDIGNWKLDNEIRSKKLDNQTSNIKLPNQASNLQYPTSGFCVYIGDATWNKNLVNLAKAIKIADVNCVFVGKVFDRSNVSTLKRSNELNIWNKELNQFFQEVGDDKRFIFPGFVTDNELIKLYEQARMNILVSRDEGFGFSVIESAMMGCPTIMSDISVFHETSQDTGIFVNPENSSEMAQSIKKLYSDTALRSRLGAQAQAKALKYSPINFHSDWQTVIDNHFITPYTQHIIEKNNNEY